MQRPSCFYELSLLHFGEDDDQSVEGEGLDQGEAQNEGELDARTSCRIACQSFGSSRGCLALSQRADAGGKRHGEPGGNCAPVNFAGSSPLREGGDGEGKYGQYQEQLAQCTHCVSPRINCRQWVVDPIPCRRP